MGRRWGTRQSERDTESCLGQWDRRHMQNTRSCGGFRVAIRNSLFFFVCFSPEENETCRRAMWWWQSETHPSDTRALPLPVCTVPQCSLSRITKNYCSNKNSQLDATITDFIDNYNQLNMFRVIISPIFRSIRLCLQLVVKCTDDAACRQHRRCIIIMIIIIIIIINLLTAIGLSPGGSGYFTCKQNMKLVTNKFNSGGLHKKHVVATWNLGKHLSICL